VHIYTPKNEKVWQTQDKAIYINYIRRNFSATLCFCFSVTCYYCSLYVQERVWQAVTWM